MVSMVSVVDLVSVVREVSVVGFVSLISLVSTANKKAAALETPRHRPPDRTKRKE